MNQAQLVYDAEETAQCDHGDTSIEQDAVEEFARDVVQRTGFSRDVFPSFEFIEQSEYDASGSCQLARDADGETLYCVIEFDPRLLDKWTICHELAHWLAPGKPGANCPHDSGFREAMIKLVERGISEYASRMLADLYQESFAA